MNLISNGYEVYLSCPNRVDFLMGTQYYVILATYITYDDILKIRKLDKPLLVKVIGNFYTITGINNDDTYTVLRLPIRELQWL